MKYFLFTLAFLFFGVAWAQEISDADFIAGLIKNLSNAKDMKVAGIVLLVLQSLFSLSKTPMGLGLLNKVTPNVRWVITNGLSIIVPAVTLIVANGTSVLDAFIGGGAGMLLMNFAFGVYERFFKKK